MAVPLHLRRRKAVHTPAFMQAILKYDPETGALAWAPILHAKRAEIEALRGLVAPGDKPYNTLNIRPPGPAFTYIDPNGYRTASIDGKIYYAHRVVWAIVKGEWPVEIDHRNRDRADNRWDNLRLATRSQNAQNSNPHQKRPTESRFTGVCYAPQWRKLTRQGKPADHLPKWLAYTSVGGKQQFLGLFHDEEDAARARDAVVRMFYGEFGVYNFDNPAG